MIFSVLVCRKGPHVEVYNNQFRLWLNVYCIVYFRYWINNIFIASGYLTIVNV
jgi:hypothetical protein